MEKDILKGFLYNDKLKFNEIERATKMRSNKLAYHLKKLIAKGLVFKEGDNYLLSEKEERIIPYLTERQAVLPVVVISIAKGKKEFFLPLRTKKPYKNLLGLPAGRILVGEKIEDSVERIMEQKFHVSAKLEKINSVSLEHVKRKDNIIHSFLLIFVSASTKDRLDYINIEKNRKRIITSDYWLLKNKNQLNLDTIISEI